MTCAGQWQRRRAPSIIPAILGKPCPCPPTCNGSGLRPPTSLGSMMNFGFHLNVSVEMIRWFIQWTNSSKAILFSAMERATFTISILVIPLRSAVFKFKNQNMAVIPVRLFPSTNTCLVIILNAYTAAFSPLVSDKDRPLFLQSWPHEEDIPSCWGYVRPLQNWSLSPLNLNTDDEFLWGRKAPDTL